MTQQISILGSKKFYMFLVEFYIFVNGFYIFSSGFYTFLKVFYMFLGRFYTFSVEFSICPSSSNQLINVHIYILKLCQIFEDSSRFLISFASFTRIFFLNFFTIY